MSRAATSPELALYRTAGKWSRLRAAIFSPTTIYTARVNQTFATTDQVLEVTYDTGSGTLADVLADMTLLVGSSAGAHDVGICRIRSVDGTKFYIGETADIAWANDLYLTVIDDFGLWAKHIVITSGTSYMDGGITYSDQHTNFDPTPVMGSHRVLKLTGATVSTTFDFSGSYVVDGSAISTYATSSPTASSGSNLTTTTPTLTWDTTGWHTVYLTLTAANGKSFWGVRYVYIWSESAPPPAVTVETAGAEAEAGGWSFGLILLENATLADIRDRALVILFAEDHWGATTQSIGPVAGSENIVCLGWIAEETINWNPEQGVVSFRVQGAHAWLGQIPAYPDGVELTTGTPAAWTQMASLTVRLGLWHFLHWRTTATRVLDVFLPDDTRLAKEVSSLAGTLWEQIREMAFLSIYARPGVNAHGQLYVEVHPQLVPEASRSWPTVLTITEDDWQGEISFPRAIKPEVAAVTLSGVAVSAAGVGTPYFSIAPGHTYPRYGALETQENLLAASQAQLNVLAGLYRSWRNNPYPEIPIAFTADIRLVDLFPRQFCALSISAGDTPRGISFSGNLVPVSISLNLDPESGHLSRTVTFEAETFEGLAVTHTIPGEGDRSVPPVPPLPPLPDFPVIIPGLGEPSANGPSVAVFHDVSEGLIYSADFDNASPTYNFFNAGLTNTQKAAVNRFFRTPSGACYCGSIGNVYTGSGGGFVARAPSLGGTWTVLFSAANLNNGANRWGITGMGINGLASEQMGLVLIYAANEIPKLYVGANLTWGGGANVSTAGQTQKRWVSYGLNKWMITTSDEVKLGAADGSAVNNAAVTPSLGTYDPPHLRASTTGRTYHPYISPTTSIVIADNNHASRVIEDTVSAVQWFDNFFGDMYIDCNPAGTYLMSRWGAGGRGRSSDSGYTWGTISALPVGSWWFSYAGPGTSTERFVAAGGSSIRYSPDFGTTWENKEGSLTSLIPVPNIDMAKVVVY